MNTSKKVKIGVIGVGHLGQHHVKHFASIPSADLMGIYDLDSTRASDIAKQFKTKPQALRFAKSYMKKHDKCRI